jgi:hypothetical protein
MTPLAAPDALLDGAGAPRFGSYSGRIREGAFDSLAAAFPRPGLGRLAVEKKWHYCGVFSPSLVVGGAIIQLGYLASAFLYVFDRLERRLLVKRSFILPPPLVTVSEHPAEARAQMRRIRSRMTVEASPVRGRLLAALSGLVDVDLVLDTAVSPPPLTLVCSLGTGLFNLTQKTSCIPAEGEVRVGPRVFKVRDAVAVLDYTHGLLPRDTKWLWASGCGRLEGGGLVGLNLVSDFNEGNGGENALWLGGRLSALGKARFEVEPDPMRPWRVTTEDDRVDLCFTPEGMRGEDVDLKLVVSQYVQPIGAFTGRVRDEQGRDVRLEGIAGVTERHRARW